MAPASSPYAVFRASDLDSMVVEPIGSVKFNGTELAGKKAFEIANAGLGYVPENRDIFPGLTTRQNLELGTKSRQDMSKSRWTIDDMFNLFENLI